MDDFAAFASRFEVDPPAGRPSRPWKDTALVSVSGYQELSERFAGRSFDGGLYRVHDDASGPQFLDVVREAFPNFAGRATPFSFDWLGRQFAVDRDRLQGGEPLVLLFEPGTGQGLEIPLTLPAFHRELDDLREPALAASFYAAWSQANPGDHPLPFSKCVGYQVPLFLGGRDVVENLELMDMDVYWSLSGELIQGTRKLPPGTSIREVRIRDGEAPGATAVE